MNFIFFFSLLFMINNVNAQYLEFDFGYNTTLGELESYSDDGFSIRASYSNNINNSNFIRWQASFQYISFYNHTYYDSFQMSSGAPGPNIEVTNSENGYLGSGGLRLTPDLGLFNDKGIFKPYASFSLGLGYFNETTTYEDPDWWNEENEFSLGDVQKQQFNFIYALELGANFNFVKWNSYGLDIGVRYNMIPAMESTNGSYSFSGNCNQSVDADGDGLCDGFIGAVELLGNKIDADYVAYYIGFTVPLETFNSKNNQKLASLYRLGY